MITPLKITFYLSCSLLLTACSTSANPSTTVSSDLIDPITKAAITLEEAKSEACPKALLEAGASPKDCSCIENRLYDLGQKPGALSPNGQPPQALFGGESGRRKIAIGLLRHDAIEQCGLFDPNHVVAKNL